MRPCHTTTEFRLRYARYGRLPSLISFYIALFPVQDTTLFARQGPSCSLLEIEIGDLGCDETLCFQVLHRILNARCIFLAGELLLRFEQTKPQPRLRDRFTKIPITVLVHVYKAMHRVDHIGAGGNLAGWKYNLWCFLTLAGPGEFW